MRAALALFLALTAPALAETPRFMDRDPACKPVATLQFLDCQVYVEYACPSVEGIDGPLWREEIFGLDGLAGISTSTENGVAIEDFATDGSYFAVSDPGDKGPSLADVLAKRGGAFDQRLKVYLQGKPGKGLVHVEVKAQERNVKLGGQTAQVFDGSQHSQLPDPVGKTESTFLAYIFPDLHMVITGERLSGTHFDPGAPPHRPMTLKTDANVNTTPAFCGGKSS